MKNSKHDNIFIEFMIYSPMVSFLKHIAVHLKYSNLLDGWVDCYSSLLIIFDD